MSEVKSLKSIKSIQIIFTEANITVIGRTQITTKLEYNKVDQV